MKLKYKVGDKVKIIKYGHNIFSYKNEQWFTQDIAPDVVGQSGIINKAETVQGQPHYSLNGIKGKCSWYNEDQLELII